MAVCSMTGYGRGSAEAEAVRVQVELRGVNNRFADVRFRMSSELAAIEGQLRRRVLQGVRRGRVEVGVNLEYAEAQEVRPLLNEPLLTEVLAAAKVIDARLGSSSELDSAALLTIPGMFRVDSVSRELDEPTRELVLAALDHALAAFDADRAREGAALVEELSTRLTKMIGHVKKLRRRAARLPSGLRDRLIERLEALRGSVELDASRVAQEAAFLADRADVTEELVRLESHLGQANTLLAQPDDEPVGKRLDFLLQEIHRETNTVCGKSTDLELTQIALGVKVETEKVREQVQNLE